MANLTAGTSLRQVSSGYVAEHQVELYAGAKIYGGAMVCRRTADGYAVRAGTANTGRVQGVAKADTATCTVSGDTNVNLLTGQFIRPCHATHTPTVADIGKAVYASDDVTISNLASDGPVAGILLGFEDNSGDAIVFIEPPSAGEVGAASKEIVISSAILAAGTPMAAFADNAGASAPGITLADSKSVGLRWNNQATQTAVWLGFSLPYDLDSSKDATIVVTASKTGATAGDATTFTITAFNNSAGALHDADVDFGGATSAMTGNAAAKTVQQVTRTLATADLGSPGDHVSMSIKPTDGTLGTDDVIIESVVLQYRRKS
jgi:hypothetical protein